MATRSALPSWHSGASSSPQPSVASTGASASTADFSLAKVALNGVPNGSEAFQRGYAKAANRVLGEAFKGLDISQVFSGDISSNVRDLRYSPSRSESRTPYKNAPMSTLPMSQLLVRSPSVSNDQRLIGSPAHSGAKWGSPQPLGTFAHFDSSPATTAASSQVTSPRMSPLGTPMTTPRNIDSVTPRDIDSVSEAYTEDGTRPRTDSTLSELKYLQAEADQQIDQLNLAVANQRGTERFNPAEHDLEVERLKRLVFDLKLENRSLGDEVKQLTERESMAGSAEMYRHYEQSIQEKEAEIQQVCDELERSRMAVTILQAEIENMDGVARNELLQEEVAQERNASAVRSVAQIISSQQIHRLWRGFVAFQWALQGRCRTEVEDLRGKQKKAAKQCLDAVAEAEKHATANQGLWRQLGMERWQCSFIALAGLLNRRRDRYVSVLLHCWSHEAVLSGGSFKRLMELKDGARRREELLRREIERGMNEISRLIVIVRTLEGRIAMENQDTAMQEQIPAMPLESTKQINMLSVTHKVSSAGISRRPNSARGRRPLSQRTTGGIGHKFNG